MKKHIVFTGGGTGGHVYPALAIIDILQLCDYKVSWIGSGNGIESRIIKELGIDFYSIPSGKLRRYFSIHNFFDLFKIFFGFIKSFFLLVKLKPDLLFSKGGYVTVPPVVCSRVLKIPSITHESDFDPGLATRINSKFVDKILVPYNETKELLPVSKRVKAIVTGNPVRRDFYNPDSENGLKIMGFTNNKPIILVLGGSLGAKEINDLLLNNRDKMTSKYSIYHQTGEKNYVDIKDESYKTTAFIKNNMADIIAAADIVISRSGAGALWEFVTVGTPSILLPLSVGSRGDQLRNAEYFTNRGCSYTISGNNIESLLTVLDRHFNEDRGESMKNSIKELDLSDCAMDIFDIIRGMA